MTKPLYLRLGPDLSLPALEAQTQTTVIYGGKGMGKTNSGAVLAEEFDAAGLRFSWIDPVGVAWGLKHSADGRGPGIPVVILGGIHGDLPIDPAAGATVADLVAEESFSVIIDISRHPGGQMWSVGEKTRFMRDYCLRLFMRQGEHRRPIMQIIDEAGRFVPQQIPAGAADVAQCVGAIEQMVELGRNVGIGVTLLTQRSARMNKSVSELADVMIAFRTVGPRSIDAIMDWFGEHYPRADAMRMIGQLRELPVGTALVVSPGWLRLEGAYAFRARRTFDSSATPVAGKESRPSGAGAVVDLAKLQERLKATVEKAQADDPRMLRARIRELEKLVAETPVTVAAPEPVVEYVAAVDEATLGRFLLGVAEAGAVSHLILSTLPRIEAVIKSYDEVVAAIGRTDGQSMRSLPPAGTSKRTPAPAIPVAQSAKRQVRAPAKTDTPAVRGGDIVTLKAGAWRILGALVRHHPTKLTKAQIGAVSSFKITGGTFQQYWRALLKAGFVAEEGKLAWATEAGIVASGETPNRPTTTEEVLAMWRGALKAGARKMLDVVIDMYPEAITKRALAGEVEMEVTGGTFGQYLGTLVRNNLVEISGQAVLARAEILMLGEWAA